MTNRLSCILTAYAYADPQVGYCQGETPTLTSSCLQPELPSERRCKGSI